MSQDHPTPPPAEIPERYREKWRDALATLTEFVPVPLAMVNAIREQDIEAFAVCELGEVHVDEGTNWKRHQGMYCDGVLDSKQDLEVPDALADPEWHNNPDLEQGLVAYLGYPLTWPTGEPFGTICMLDTSAHEFSTAEKKLMRLVADGIADDLEAIYTESRLHEAEEAVADSEGHLRMADTVYQTLFREASDAILLHEMNGNILAGNPAASALLGYTESELSSLHARDIASPNYKQNAEPRLQQLEEQGEALFRTVLMSKHSEEIPAEVATRVIDLDGKKTIFSIIRVLADRLLPEEQVRQSEKQLNEAQRIAHIGNWIWDIESNAVVWSNETYRLLGYEPNEMRPTYEDFVRRVHTDDVQLVEEALRKAVESNIEYDCTYRVVLESGEERICRSLGEVHCDDDGKPSTLIGTVQDVTIRHALEEEVLESRDKFQTLIENLGDRFVVFQEDLDGMLLYISSGARTVFGLDPEQMIGSFNMSSVEWLPKTKELFKGRWEALLNTGRMDSVEEEFMHPDGSVRTLNTNAHVVYNRFGKPIRIDGIAEDITDRKEAERVIALSEKRLRESQMVASIGTWDWDLIHDTVYWTPLLYTILHVDESKTPSYDYYTSLVHPDDRANVRRDAEYSIEHGTHFDSIHRLTTPDGIGLVIHLLADIEKDEQGNSIRMYGTLMDITELVNLQDELRESRDRFKNLVEDLGDDFVAFQYDLEGTLLYISSGTKELFGIPANDLIGKNIATAIHWTPETLSIMPQKIPSLLRIERVNGFEDTFIAPDGTVRTLSVNAHVVRDSDGEPQFIEGLFEDITERKHAELTLRKNEAQLREAQRIARIGNWVFSVSEERMEINEGLAAICGIQLDVTSLSYQEFMDLIPEEDTKQLVALMADAMIDKQPKTFVHRIIRPDGQTRYVQAKAIPILNGSNQVAEFFGTMMDITEHHLLEQDLAASRDKYRQLIEDLGDKHIVFQHQPNGNITYVSPSVESMFGIPVGEAIGGKFTELVEWNKDDIAEVSAVLAAILNGEAPRFTEARFRHRNGEWRTLRSYAHMATGPDGETYIEGIGEDVTEQKRLETELRESHDRYKQLIEELGETYAVYRHTIDGDFLYVSPSAEYVFGVPAEECIGKQVGVLINWTRETRLTMISSIRKYHRGERIYAVEGQYHDRDGTLRTLSNTAHPVRDEQGNILYIEGIVEDITERKNAETELAERSRLLKDAQRIANLGNWVFDVETEAMKFSEEMYRIYGAATDEDLSSLEKCLPFVHPEDLPKMMKVIERVLDTHEPYIFEHRVVRPNGEIRYVTVNGEVVLDADGVPVQIIGTMQDITERQLLQQELQDSHDRFKGMVEDLGDDFLVYRHNLEGKLSYASPGMFTIFGVEPEYAIGRTYLEIIHWNDATLKAFPEVVAHIVEHGKTPRGGVELGFYNKDGQERVVNVNSHLISDDAGKPQGIEGIVEDITDRKRAEQALVESEQNLRVAQRMARIGNWALDLQTQGVDLSDEIYRIYGVERDVDLTVFDNFLPFIHPDDQELLETSIKNAVATLQSYRVNIRIVRRTGEIRYTSVVGEVVTDADGNAVKIIGTQQDNTEQHILQQELQESHDRFRSMVEDLGDNFVVYQHAIDGTLQYASPGFKAVFGINPEDAIGKPYQDIIQWSQESIELRNARIETIIAEGRLANYELQFTNEAGEERVLNVNSHPVYDDNGNALYIEGIVEDITERKRAEQALIESEYNLNEAQRIGHIGNFTYHIAEDRLLYSDEVFRILGYEPGEVEPTYEWYKTVVHPEDREFLYTQFDDNVVTGSSFVREYRVIRKDGAVRYLRSHGEVSTDTDGKPKVLRGVILDTTDQKLAEQQILESQELLRHAQHIAHLGNWQYDLLTKELTVSDEMYNILALPKDTDFSDPLRFLSLLHPDDQESNLHSVLDALEGSDIYTTQHRIVNEEGETRYVNVNAEIVRNKDGQPVKILGTTQDITELVRAEKAVAERDRYLKEAARIALIGNWTWTAETGEFKSSDEIFRIFGEDPTKKDGGYENYIDMVHPDDREEVESLFQHNFSENPLFERRYRIYRRGDGELRYMRSIVEGTVDSDGNLIEMLGTMQDITELSLAERNLQESRERFDLAVRATREGIWDVDYVNNRVYFSPQWKKQLGYEDSELANELATWADLIHPDDRERVLLHVEGAKDSGSPNFDLDYRMVHKSGRDVYLYSRANITRDQKGNVIRIVGTHQDITDRKALENALKVYKKFADSSSQAFGMSNPDTTIAYVNSTLAKLLGGDSPDDIIGKSFLDFYPDELKDFLRNQLIETLVKDSSWTGELRLRALDGKETPTIENFFLIRDEKGNPLFISDALTPIAEMKEKEEMLERARAAAELANKAKSEFLANMSHEIRTPMNAIVGMSHLALNTAMTPKQRDYMFKIDNAAKMLLGIINDVLDFSKIEAGKLELEKKPFDLETVVVQCIDLVRTPAYEQNLELIVQFDPSLPRYLVGDALRIGQVLNNLLQNAVKFTKEGTIAVEIRVHSRHDHSVLVDFAVTDTGIGITPEQRERLFSVFTQADGSITRKYGGTGLGLAISKQLVELMDGIIGVASQPGKGSTFSFSIPLPIDTSAGEERIIRQFPSAIRGKKVLVVDAHTAARDNYSALLETMGMAVQHYPIDGICDSVDDMLTEASKHAVVMIDPRLHCKSNDSIYNTLIASNLRKARTILLEAGPVRTGTIADARVAGFSAVLEKPLHPTDIYNTIQNVLLAKPDAVLQTYPKKERQHTLNNAHVLVVEDNDVNMEVAIELLTQAGLTVSTAVNGKEAVERVGQEHFDLLLMDIQMPIMDGITATEHIRELAGCAKDDLPIIAMTAYAMAGDADRCIEAGMNGYLPKPIDPEELQAALKQWLPKSAVTPTIGTKQDNELDAPWVKVLEDHGIEASDALKVIHGNEAFFHKMLSKFIGDYTGAPEQIRKLLQQGKHEDAHILAHSIKSVAGYIGAKTLWEHTVALEQAIKDKSDEWPSPLEDFKSSIETTSDVIHMAFAADSE